MNTSHKTRFKSIVTRYKLRIVINIHQIEKIRILHWNIINHISVQKSLNTVVVLNRADSCSNDTIIDYLVRIVSAIHHST